MPLKVPGIPPIHLSAASKGSFSVGAGTSSDAPIVTAMDRTVSPAAAYVNSTTSLKVVRASLSN